MLFTSIISLNLNIRIQTHKSVLIENSIIKLKPEKAAHYLKFINNKIIKKDKPPKMFCFIKGYSSNFTETKILVKLFKTQLIFNKIIGHK